MVQIVKNLPAMQETHVWSLGREDALEKGRWDWLHNPVYDVYKYSVYKFDNNT